MKILAINSSPNREGSTVAIIDLFLEECKFLGATCDKVHIEDYLSGFEQGEEAETKGVGVFLEEDYIQLKARMVDADAIIIGSPYYNGKPVINIKILIERLQAPVFGEKTLKNKYVVGISTSAVNNCRNVAEYCANIGFKASFGGIIISGLISEQMMSDVGLKDVELDTGLNARVKKEAHKLINNIKNNKIPILTKIQGAIIPGYLNVALINILLKYNITFKKFKNSLKDKGFINGINDNEEIE